MLEPWANDIVICLAGVVLGALLSLANILSPETESERTRKDGETLWEWQKRRRRGQDERLANAPRSYTLVTIAFFGFVVVFIVALVISPLRMQWSVFFGGLFAAFAFGSVLPTLVKRGKIPRGDRRVALVCAAPCIFIGAVA